MCPCEDALAVGRFDIDRALEVGDPLADEALAAASRHPMPGVSAWARVRRLEASEPACAALIRQVRRVPGWVDPASLRAGQRLFARHAVDATTVFTLDSLVETYLVPGIARVLVDTKLLVDQVQRRLAETAKMVLDVVTPGALAPGGAGIDSIMRVRLLHAQVRSHLAQRRAPGSAPLAINQAQMMLTLHAHSWLILRGLRRLGIRLDPVEAAGYQHLWRYAGYLIGVAEDGLADSIEAEARSYDHMAARLFGPSEAGVRLTVALHDAAAFEPPLFLPRSVIVQFTAFLLGPERACMLDVYEAPHTQASLRTLSSVRRQLNHTSWPRFLPPRASGQGGLHSAPQRASWTPRAGINYYNWMVQRSARLAGVKLP